MASKGSNKCGLVNMPTRKPACLAGPLKKRVDERGERRAKCMFEAVRVDFGAKELCPVKHHHFSRRQFRPLETTWITSWSLDHMASFVPPANREKHGTHLGLLQPSRRGGQFKHAKPYRAPTIPLKKMVEVGLGVEPPSEDMVGVTIFLPARPCPRFEANSQLNI